MYITFSRRLPFILGSVFVAGLFLFMLGWLLDARASLLLGSPTVSYRHIALMGDEATIASVTAPAINAGEIRLLRRYTNTAAFLYEAPTDYFPGGPPPAALELYEALAPPSQATDIIMTLAISAVNSGLQVEYQDLTWLSYMPNKVIISGVISDINNVASHFGLTGVNTVTLSFCSSCAGRQIRLYETNENNTSKVSTLVPLINNYAVSQSLTVTAEPNYLIVGAQGHIAGSPGGPLERDAVQLLHTRRLTTTGVGVKVFIFDASSVTTGIFFIQGVSVTASAPVVLPADLPSGTYTSGTYMPAHGTFVATPVTQLAPAAGKYLVRVLNEYSYGDSHHFMQAAEKIMNDHAANSVGGLVFNYSFVQEAPTSSGGTALEQFLTAVADEGVLQIAAAGNDSAFTLSPQDMRLPAAHDKVRGVAAVTPGNHLACYSNHGDISALGGGIPRGGEPCKTHQIVRAKCGIPGAPAGLETCVTGWDPASDTFYSWGLGTSYAAPIATGMAAQAFEFLRTPYPRDGTIAGGEQGGSPDPDEVWAFLESLATPACDPALGAGILLGPPEPVNCEVYLPMVTRP